MKHGFHLWMVKPKSSQSSGCTHLPNKPKKFIQTSACQKADGNCFLGQERSAYGGIHETRDHNNIWSVLQNTKNNLYRAIQIKRHGMLASGVVFLHDNACLHIAACTWALMENLNWGLYDQPPYSLNLAPSDYHLFTYLKNWLGSQELMEGIKTWLSSKAADSFDIGIQRLIPQYKCLNSCSDYVERSRLST
jgi:hypothetical protein